jgi:predicted NUDIX family phosphoesterase
MRIGRGARRSEMSGMGLDERILVVPRPLLLPDGGFHGVRTADVETYRARIRAHGEFRRRGDVEDDPSLKQIIPYLVVRAAGRYLLVERTRGGAEARLHGLASVGVGGHIDGADVAGAVDPVEAGLRRELAEELVVEGPWTARLVGVLNDDTNPVSSVHFGLVYVVDVPSGRVRIRETDKLVGRLVGPEAVRAAYPQMETWSQLVVDAGVLFS